METGELLLGFDAREMWLNFDDTWTQDDKNLYLLKHDIDKVLSTYPDIWPSVFSLDNKLETPPWIGLLDELWENLQTMESYLQKGWGPTWKPCYVIALTRLSSLELKLETESKSVTSPSDLDKNWSLLGYDISDEYLLSGLSSCGYSESDNVSVLRDRWAPHLNKYHLFTEKDQAIEFREMTDRRVPEHAPFFVYGIYLIRSVGKD
jgi:hypothetical protein